MSIRQKTSYLRAALGIMHGSSAFGGPVQASIDLTNRCNIRCSHCYFYSPHVRQPNFEPVREARRAGAPMPDAEAIEHIRKAEIAPERLSRLVGELLRMGTRRFQLSGGEPLLHGGLMETVERLKRAGAYCFLNTNATLIDAATADAFVTHGLDEVRVTLMAGSPDVYLRTHPGVPEAMFDSIKESLLRILGQKQQRGVVSPRVSLILIVISENADGLIQLAEFADDVGADEVVFRPVDDVGDPGLMQIVPSPEQARAAREQLPEARAFLESKGIAHNIPAFERVFGTQLDTRAFHELVPCYYGWLATRINAEGDVYPCCRCYEPMGNIHEQAFSGIWHGEAYRRFRSDALQLPGRGTPVNGCDCYSCVHHTANLGVYNALHPIGKRAMSRDLAAASPGGH